jgi:aminobenzoyl-glutamate utilization protein B
MATEHSRRVQLTTEENTTISWIEKQKARYHRIATYIWNNPELGLGEFKSSRKLREYLTRSGFTVESGVAGMETAFVATRGAGKPVVGFLAEFDALPGLSQKAGIASREPVGKGAPGHGCGHNLLGTSSALAAVALARTMEKYGIKGSIKVFGAPAEETLVGKVFMNRDGLFEGTDVMISWHPDDITGVDYRSSLAMDNMKFRFHGRPSHAGAAPEAGRSALDAVELMNVGANYMREHIVQDARVHYIITKGGEAPNIVPAFAEAWYYIRAPRRAQVDEIRTWLIDIAKGAALMSGTTMDWLLVTAVYEWLPNKVLARGGDEIVRLVGPPLVSDEDRRFGASIVKSLGPGDGMDGEPFPSLVSTPDFGRTFPDVEIAKISKDVNYSWRIPSVEFVTATMARGTPLHSWQTVCQTAMPHALNAGLQASKYMALEGLTCLTDTGLLKAAWMELDQYRAKWGYREPVPEEARVPTFKEIYGQ